MMQPFDRSKLTAGIAALKTPLLPLVRIVQLLYLTGPFASVREVLAELNEPVETETASYPDPAALLRPHLDLLGEFDRLKSGAPLPVAVFDEDRQPLDPFEALELWIGQQLVERELETINSLLCGPCDCTLCCTGPAGDQRQLFFEIPLADGEIDLFPLAAIDTEASRRSTADREPPLAIDGSPFYEGAEPRLCRWQTGWSMILPTGSRCPHLDPASGGCRIYPRRPSVCRRPQIFAYLLERAAELDSLDDAGNPLPAHIGRRKLLAVWDCPYVRQCREEVILYAEACGLEPVFKENKA